MKECFEKATEARRLGDYKDARGFVEEVKQCYVLLHQSMWKELNWEISMLQNESQMSFDSLRCHI